MVAFLLAFLLAMAQMGALIAAIMVAVLIAARTRRAASLWLLAVIVRRRLPLAVELEALGEGLSSADRWRMNGVAGRVRSGSTLAEALAATPGLVPDDTVVLAHVAERSDSLGETLSSEAARLTHLRDVSIGPGASPMLSTLYLIAVPIVLPTILTGLMIFIIPKYKKIFDDFGSELPALTRELIASSDFVAKYWYLGVATFLMAATVAGIALVLSRVSSFEFVLPRFVVPGSSGRRSSLALRALAIATRAGRPVTTALDPLANLSPTAFDRWKFDRLRQHVHAGKNVWTALADERLVSGRDAELLAAAERAGNLAWVLEMLAERGDVRRLRRWLALLEIAQPCVVLVLGALVFFVSVGMFLPMIKLLNDLS